MAEGDEILPPTGHHGTQSSFGGLLRFGESSRSGHLLRILGVGFGLAVGIGNTIGGGILRTPGEVAGYVGNGWLLLFVWLLGGVYALLSSSSVTELGCMLPRAGGWYVYSRRAFGEKAGFVVGCCDFTVSSVANATVAVAFAEFAGELVPVLPDMGNCSEPPRLRRSPFSIGSVCGPAAARKRPRAWSKLWVWPQSSSPHSQCPAG